MSDDDDEERRRRNPEFSAQLRNQELGMLGRGLRVLEGWLSSLWRRIRGG